MKLQLLSDHDNLVTVCHVLNGMLGLQRLVRQGGIVVFLGVALCGLPDVEAGPECLQCTDIADVTACNTTAVCSDLEECFVDLQLNSSGSLVYTLGCRTKQLCEVNEKASQGLAGRQAQRVIMCSTCCQQPHCNSEHCLERPDPCLSSPCQNGGSCVSWGSTFTCTCKGGFQGDLCQTGHCDFVSMENLGCGGKQDLVFLFSLGARNVHNPLHRERHELTFLHRLVKDPNMDIGSQTTHVALLGFSSQVHTYLGLTGDVDQADKKFLQLASHPPHDPSVPLLGKALDYVLNHTLTDKQGARPNARKVVLVMVNHPDQDLPDILAASQRLRDACISLNILAVWYNATTNPSSQTGHHATLQQAASYFGPVPQHFLHTNGTQLDTASSVHLFDKNRSCP